ncbi:MAG: hypothetical protein AAGD22_08160 [Verrucomicrobiota bacterium]
MLYYHTMPRHLLSTLAIALALSLPNSLACPFCQLLEEATIVDLIDDYGVVAIAELTTPSLDAATRMRLSLRDKSKGAPNATLTAKKILKGDTALAPGDPITVPFLMPPPAGPKHLIVAPSPETLEWLAPVPLSDHALAFIEEYRNLTPPPQDAPVETIVEYLAVFTPYLYHEDETLSTAAYGEFAKSPYPVVTQVAANLDPDALLTWIQDENVSVDRRRLFLTLLGVCGSAKAHAPTLAEWIKKPKQRHAVGADALAAAYLKLMGAKGLPLVEKTMLTTTNQNKNAANSDNIFAALGALEFHAFQAPGAIPKKRLIKSFRLALDHPESADLAIPDLALLEDWDSIPRLLELYHDHGEEFAFLKEPVILFLRTCPLPEAAQHLAELAKIDPKLVENTEGKYTAEELWGPAEN